MTIEQAKEQILKWSGNSAWIEDEELYAAFIPGVVFGIGIKELWADKEGKPIYLFVVFTSDDGHYWPIGTSEWDSKERPPTAALYWLDDLKHVCDKAQQYCLYKGWNQSGGVQV